MQLTMEQRIFIAKSYYKTKSYNQFQTKFRTLFPERLPLNKTTIRKNVKKYEKDGTYLNMNKGRSGRRITTRTQENIETVREALDSNQERISGRRDGLGIPLSSFCRIIKKDLHWYPCKMIRRHDLKDGDYERRSHFCYWFMHQCNNRRFLANFVTGDKTGFALNGAVNSYNVRMYASVNQQPDFHYNVNDSRKKIYCLVRIMWKRRYVGSFLF